MNATRDNNFTDKQKRGIDLICKSLMKKYTFIYDWELVADWEKWITHLYIDLYIDVEKLSEIFDKPISPYYQKLLDSGEKINTSVLLLPLFLGEYDTPEYDKYSDLSYNAKREMELFINNLYDNLPEEMVIKWKGEYGNYTCGIRIDNFIEVVRYL